MDVVRTVRELRQRVSDWRQSGKRIALVPTMGALHAAHDALIKEAGRLGSQTVVSIFVNPRQFGEEEDLGRYPQDEENDLHRLQSASVDLVFVPDSNEMYSDGFSTSIVPAGPALGLCGDARPWHFEGVATVVAKLLLQCQPDVAVFGEKDYQQLLVVRRLVLDLNIPSEIAAIPTVREADGFACSSRNIYLNEEERRIAPALHSALAEASGAIAAGAEPEPHIEKARQAIGEAGYRKIDYVELRDAETLTPVPARTGQPARLLGAAWLGPTRLIDNIPLTF